MKERDRIITCLEQSPGLLRSLLSNISQERLKLQRKPDEWSIHEHACHLAEAEEMILKRFQDFKNNDFPEFEPYLPGKTIEVNHLMQMDLDEKVRMYDSLRNQLVNLVSSFDETIWSKQAEHHEYMEYNAGILLRHTLMHDHFHMYRIEELWLTKSEFL